MSLYGLDVTCLYCGGDNTTRRDCVQRQTLRTSVHVCTACGHEFAITITYATVTPPPPPIDERARRYRANKKAAAA